MQLHPSCHESVWPFWQKLLFRFSFIFLGLHIVPLSWLYDVPLFKYLAEWYDALIEAMVKFANAHFFHVKDELVLPNGSGDTSFAWAQLLTFTWLALFGCIIWSAIDRKKQNYARLNYLLCIGIRYYIAFVALLYGILKVFALQMIFPSISQMATPLGDLLPMRFSWLFIGYSTPYQVFSGAMEVTVGLLLLYRRTATFGSVMAFVVFTNVMMLNLSYDIPVKLFSMQLTILSFFLLVQENRRIIAFFILNKDAASCSVYIVSFKKRWMRVTRIVLKCFFVLLALHIAIDTYANYKSAHVAVNMKKPFKQALYDIAYIIKPTDTAKAWKNMVFDNDKSGSINIEDSMLRRRYGRSYFGYKLDTLQHVVYLSKQAGDSIKLYSFHYAALQNEAILLNGKAGTDSVAMQLSLSKHRFQLAEKQFHWLSESNR